jgi:hypothetical protein
MQERLRCDNGHIFPTGEAVRASAGTSEFWGRVQMDYVSTCPVCGSDELDDVDSEPEIVDGSV